MRADLDLVNSIAGRDHYLAAVATRRAGGSMQSSVVNAGVMPHPVSGAQVVAFVAFLGVKVRHLRARSEVTLTFRAGWEWATVEGTAELAGPDDPLDRLEEKRLPGLLRDIFTAAGGTHEDWDEYDRVMAAERRVAVLVTPARIYTSG